MSKPLQISHRKRLEVVVGEPEAGPCGERVVPIAKLVAHGLAAPLEELHGVWSEGTCVLHNKGQNGVGSAVTVQGSLLDFSSDCTMARASGRTTQSRGLDNGCASHVSNDVGTCVRPMKARMLPYNNNSQQGGYF